MAVRSWDGIIGVATLKSLIGLRQHDRGHADLAFPAISVMLYYQFG
jgi:hypothetical protein